MTVPSQEPARPPSATVAWVDASNGVAGDMLLGALVDAGAPLDRIRDAVEAVMPATVEWHVAEVRRAGMRATKVDVEVVADDLPHRDWTTIRAMLASAPLDARVQADAQARPGTDGRGGVKLVG